MNGRLLILASAVAFGTLGAFGKLVYSHGGDPLTLLFVRFVAAAGALAIIVAVTGGYRVPRRAVLLGLALGLVFYFGQSFSFFEGLAHAPAGLVVLLFYMWPLLVTLGGAAFFGECLSVRQLTVLTIGLVGVALASGSPGGSSTTGVVLGLVAGVFYAGYLLGGKGLLRGDLTSYQLTALAFIGPAIVYSGIVGVRGVRFPEGLVGWSALAGVVLLGTVLPTMLLFAGLRHVDAGTASLLSIAEPLAGVLLAYVVLGEALTTLQSIGGALVVVAVGSLSVGSWGARARGLPALERRAPRGGPVDGPD